MHFIEIIICHVLYGKTLSLHVYGKYQVIIKSCALYSFKVLKNVILILLKEKYILGRIGLTFGDLGRS